MYRGYFQAIFSWFQCDFFRFSTNRGYTTCSILLQLIFFSFITLCEINCPYLNCLILLEWIWNLAPGVINGLENSVGRSSAPEFYNENLDCSWNEASLSGFLECGRYPVPLVPQPMGRGKYETNNSSHLNLLVIGDGRITPQEAIYSQDLLCSRLQRSHIAPFGHNLGPNRVI